MITFLPGGMLRLQVIAHHGPEVALPDGEIVRAGDAVGEIHVDSVKLSEMFRELDERRIGIYFLRGLVEALHALAVYLREHPDLSLRAIVGNTMFWHGSDRIGFVIFPIADRRRRWQMGLWLRFLMWYYHPRGAARMAGRSRFAEPRQVWMSTPALMHRYEASADEGRRMRRAPRSPFTPGERPS
ncbi:MAG: hypothetical protein FJX78_03180 [Armatimonadetes bacterium]|nr:hypothetical protein [Armatimonadota bacterium]